MNSPDHSDSPTAITSVDELLAHYGQPPEGAILKEVTQLSTEYRRWISQSRFFAMATVGPEGLDCSPRGDRDQAVHIVDDHTIHIPDRRGNNRLDSLRNIVRDGRLALLFFIPGITECVRINGTAVLTADETLRTRYAVDDKLPATVIVLQINAVYFQCARALKRSRLWDPDARVPLDAVPTAGQMTAGARPSDFDAEAYDAALADRQARTLY